MYLRDSLKLFISPNQNLKNLKFPVILLLSDMWITSCCTLKMRQPLRPTPSLLSVLAQKGVRFPEVVIILSKSNALFRM